MKIKKFKQFSRASILINPDLIPRSSVIDTQFITAEVIEKQNILELKMERLRRQTLQPTDDDDDDFKSKITQ